MIAVNLTGPFNIVKAALPFLTKADAATIVNIASVSALMPMPGTAGYSASKAGAAMFTKSIAMDLGPKIRANTICPGVIKTEMTRYLWENTEHTVRAAERVLAGGVPRGFLTPSKAFGADFILAIPGSTREDLP